MLFWIKGGVRMWMKDWKKMKGNKGMMCCGGGNAGGAVYGLGFLGALVYYLTHSLTLGATLLGVVKAVIWPAIVIFKLLEVWKM